MTDSRNLMKTRHLILVLALAFGLLPSSFALTVTGVVQTAQSAQRTNVLMTFTPLSGPSQSQPGVFTTSESVYTRSSTNAAWSIALKAGWYGMKVGSNPRDVAVLAVTNGSATVAYTDISTNLPLYVYPVAPWNLSSGPSSTYQPGSNVSFTTNVDGSITISATLTGGAASLGDITNVFASLSGGSFSNFIGLARFNTYSNALVSIALASDAATSNALTDLSYTIGTAATNYSLTTSNYLLTLALAANTATSNSLQTLAYSIGANSTNYALAIGLAATNRANQNQFGSLLLSNAVASGRINTNGWVAGSNVTLSTNAGGDITITATLSGGAATLGDITNVFANLSGPSQSNFVSRTEAAATFQSSTNYANAIGSAGTNKANAIGGAATNAVIAQGAGNTNHAESILQSSTNYANTVASNRVAVVAGNGGVTVSSAANGTRQEFTINTPTNFSTITASNIVQALQSQFAGTNAAALTNITVTLGTRTFLFATNNLTFTNILGITPTNSSDTSIYVIPTLVNRTITWPSMRTPIFGGLFTTNAGGGGELFPTFTNGIGYTVSITTYGTNAVWSCLAWPQ